MLDETQVAETTASFLDFGLSPEIMDGVTGAGYETPTPIQTQSIPLVLSGKDVIGQAQTGTGKTAAYALPTMSRMKQSKNVEILVLCPTRELATQVSDEMYKLGKFAGIKTVPVVGGQHLMRQVELVNRGAQVVVATPGRLMDHLRSGRLKNFKPSMVILDEADEMLDMGFIDDVRDILKGLPEDRQTLLFSATMPPEIRALANEFMKNPEHVKLNSIQQTNADIEQRVYVVRADEKDHALLRILDVEDPAKAIIFCRTKRDVDTVTETLLDRQIAARAIHGDMSQPMRNQTVDMLKSGQVKIVVATDVAARGLDIRGVSHVINFHVPDNRERYIHRIGRTGRAGERGIAMTLATPGDIRNNQCFYKAHAKDFIVHAVPNRSAAQQTRAHSIAKMIQDTVTQAEWDSTVDELLKTMPPKELVSKLLARVVGNRRIIGPDLIGISQEQAQKMLNREPIARSGGHSSHGGKFGSRDDRRQFFSKGRPRQDFQSDDRRRSFDGPRGPRSERSDRPEGGFRRDRPRDEGSSGRRFGRSFDRDRNAGGGQSSNAAARPPKQRHFDGGSYVH
jgi:ATP-dependent RNA helicase DeaD